METVQLTDLNPNSTIVLDSHLIKTFRSCQKKFWWFEEQHIIAKTTSAAPAFGIAMHEGIASFRAAKMEGLNFNAAYETGAKSLLTAYKKHMPITSQSDVMQDDARSPRNALRIFTGYCHHYEASNLKFLHVEVPFAMLLGNFEIDSKTIDVIYTGIIDAVLEQHSRIYVNDLKTTGWNIDQKFLDGFKMDQGLIGYMNAAKAILGIDTNYAVVHAIWVKAEAKDPKRAKPLDEYFQTKELFWDTEQIEEWQENTLLTAQQIYRTRQNNGPWIMDWGSNCSAYGGCSYRNLCSATPKARSQLINLDYDHALWRPLEDERLQKITD